MSRDGIRTDTLTVAIEHTQAGVVSLTIRGAVDPATVDQFATALSDADARSTGGVMVLDLAGLEFIDSSGLSALLIAARRAVERGGRLQTKNTPDHARRLFHITALDQSLIVH
jgi:anti-sigma B factor antagonist